MSERSPRVQESRLEDLQRAEEIFFSALELGESERRAYVESQCAGDAKLFAQVYALLQADAAAGSDDFLGSKFLAAASLDTNPTEVSRYDQNIDRDARFEIISKHNQGGLGEVLIAHDRELNREIAIKQVRTKWLSHDEAKDRFVQEAEVTGQLEHPGVVPVYAMGTWKDGRPFYAMRFIKGQTLKEVIAQHHGASKTNDLDNAMNLRGILNRFIDVCNTIEYAHSRKIIHRDIKPANIMVGPYGETLVVDWGLAKVLDSPDGAEDSSDNGIPLSSTFDSGGADSGRTQIGSAIGTPQYMSPEQAAGQPDKVGVQTDVYLLGATLFQILTGVPPHDDESITKLVSKVKQGGLVSPREIRPSISPALESVCLKAMATKPIDRYASANELAADVERYLADKPVLVHKDSFSIRLGRWFRSHRTAAISGFIAATLITVGSVAGSLFWSYQHAQRKDLESQRNAKELQLATSRQQRLNELRASADSALDLSVREIHANRFLAASNVLQNAIDVLGDEPSMADAKQTIQSKCDRVDRIVRFYDQVKLTQEYNVLSRDALGLLSSKAGLISLGVWEKVDWWNHLPDQDLTPEQRDRLRWDVYQEWLMLDGMLVKTIGNQIFGLSGEGSHLSVISTLRKLKSDAGKKEAAASVVVSDRIEWFRRSETTKWYRGIANYRLGKSRRVAGRELGTATNAADAQKLGVLCLISAMDPSFRVVFRDYKQVDSLAAARDLFQRSASLRPDHFWSQLALGHLQYFVADKEAAPTWKSYQPAVQTMGRCLALDPQSCFALADRASLFRFQSEKILLDTDLSEQERLDRKEELLRWALRDAQMAYASEASHPWLGWPYGLALFEARQRTEAIEVFLRASIRSQSLEKIANAMLVRADDIRGRSEVIEKTQTLIKANPDDSKLRTLLASIWLNRYEHEEAKREIDIALQQANAPPHAYAVRGMLSLRDGDWQAAERDFLEVIKHDNTHVWAWHGLGECAAHSRRFAESTHFFARGNEFASTGAHRAACQLAMARSTAVAGQCQKARQLIESAVEIEPAIDLLQIAKPLIDEYKRIPKTNGEAKEQLKRLIKSISGISAKTRIEFEQPNVTAEPIKAALLNGDFELNELRYWSDEIGVEWRNVSGYSASTKVSSDHSHNGNGSLHISGAPADSPEQFGTTSQSFPVPQNSRCRLSVWVKANELSEGALAIEIDDHVKLSIPAGTFDWREFSTEIEVGKSEDPFLTTVSLRLRLVSSGEGDAYLDDIELKVSPKH